MKQKSHIPAHAPERVIQHATMLRGCMRSAAARAPAARLASSICAAGSRGNSLADTRHGLIDGAPAPSVAALAIVSSSPPLPLL